MLWLGLILVIQISILNPAFASDDICPPFTFYNGSNECVPCSSCKDGGKQLVIRACSGHADTVCATIYDLTTKLPGFPRAKKRKDPLTTDETALIGKWPAQRKNKATFIKNNDDNDNVFDVVSNPDYDEHGFGSSRVDIVKAAEKTNNDQSLRLASKNPKPNYESDHFMRYLIGSIPVEAVSGKKFGFNKNGKHIKKDLSMSDSVKRPVENSTFSSATESTLNQTLAAKSKKGTKSKPKKNLAIVNDHPVSIMDTKFFINGQDKNQPFSFVHPHVENHKIYLEMEKDVPGDRKKASSTLFAATKSDKRPPNPLILIKNNFTANKMAVPPSVKNNTDLHQFHQLIDGLADILSNNSHERTSNESSSVASVDDNKNGVLPKQSVHDDDYLADETDGDGDEDDDDDEEDGDDEDDDYDENDDDDDEDDDEDEDEDTDPSSSNRLLGGNKKVKHLSFGTGSNSHSLNLEDDDDEDDDDGVKFNEDDDYGVISVDKSSNKKWHQGETDVNVEPYSNSPDWQLLMLVSVVSACLLFFVFVNIYICIYMKKWKHMKSNFEADVEDLSVRINLMQHGGLDVDDQHYVKDYMTQLKSGRTTEKSSSASLREK